MIQWEKDVKAEFDYTGNWKDSSIYTGKSGYALLYLQASKSFNSVDYLDQAFFMAEKCTMHLHVHTNAKDLTFLTGAGGPLAISAVCAHLLNQPEKEQHFVHRLGYNHQIIFLVANLIYFNLNKGYNTCITPPKP